MVLNKSNDKWMLIIERKDNLLGLINIIRYLDDINGDINKNKINGLQFEMNLQELESVNSELIAQFVILQTSLVRYNGRLKIVEANPELKGTFDVVMLDKIISIQYLGLEESDSYDDDYSEE